MPNVWDGTHLFLWQANRVFSGDPNAMIAQAKELGLTGVLIKFANGSLTGDPISQAYMAQFRSLVQPFKAAGFKVGGWIYQYLTDVQGEVDACFQAIDAGADWIILDGEVELQGKNSEVIQFGNLFRAKYPDYPLGLSSFAIANYHPEVPFDEYNAYVDVMMPQIYWGEMGWDVSVAFHASIASYQRFNKPMAPTGQSEGSVDPAQMATFVQLSRDAGFSGISWWDWQGATATQLAAIGSNILRPPSTIANDVQVNDEYSVAIQYILNQGYMHVDVEGNFNPNQTVTRGMLSQVLYNMYQTANGRIPAPTSRVAADVGVNDAFAEAIQYILGKGIMHVDASGNFNPNQTVSRGMLSQVLYNIYQLTHGRIPSPTAPVAADVGVNDDFAEAIQYVLNNGYMHVDAQGNFYPNQSVTRGMLSQIIYNQVPKK